jgi:large subunit ribosomal protein L30e
MSSKKSKGAAESVTSRLQLVIKSGKYTLGWKSTIKAIRNGKAKLVLVAGNCPAIRKSEMDYYGMLSKVPIHAFTGSNNDLGTVCGRFYRVSVLAITDPGDSDILTSFEA